MPNRRLSPAELGLANALLEEVRDRLAGLAASDVELHFALRRKVAKELVYDERNKPMRRRALKRSMRVKQEGRCPLCTQPLPETYCVLDRLNAIDGYIETNVRLICETCDRRVQRERRYT